MKTLLLLSLCLALAYCQSLGPGGEPMLTEGTKDRLSSDERAQRCVRCIMAGMGFERPPARSADKATKLWKRLRRTCASEHGDCPSRAENTVTNNVLDDVERELGTLGGLAGDVGSWPAFYAAALEDSAPGIQSAMAEG